MSNSSSIKVCLATGQEDTADTRPSSIMNQTFNNPLLHKKDIVLKIRLYYDILTLVLTRTIMSMVEFRGYLRSLCVSTWI